MKILFELDTKREKVKVRLPNGSWMKCPSYYNYEEIRIRIPSKVQNIIAESDESPLP